jgi:ADP-dependent NAD(P)H-hydrate dehydratase / NAD(P)H-hydrate epimerase
MTRLDGGAILTAAEMRAAEDRAIAGGATVASLMARAGEAVATAVRRVQPGADVLVLCGPGNNGGDGYVAAASLAASGQPVRIAAIGEPRSGAAREARAAWTGPVERLGDAAPASVVVDALFGTGLSRRLDVDAAAALRRLVEESRWSLAVDLPSGVETDTGRVFGETPRFDLTLALGAAKPAHVLEPAASLSASVRVADIGVAAEGAVRTLARPRLNPPSAADHKYTRGLVAVIAGRMPGASALAAEGAAHGGSGYVLLLGSATDRLPHAIVRRRFEAESLADDRIGAVLIGPGLGRDDAAREKLGAALACDRPLVIDGDALRLIDAERLAARTAPTILTPHGGEFSHLFRETNGGKIARTLAAARTSGATVIHKGADTVIADPDGEARVAVEKANWLSTAGTGDVLAGLVAARLGATGDPLRAASEAVWLHTAAAQSLEPAFIADDLAAALPSAISRCL